MFLVDWTVRSSAYDVIRDRDLILRVALHVEQINRTAAASEVVV